MQTSYFVYIKDFLANQDDPNMRYVISYRLSSVNNFIETKMNSLIEVPYYDEDEFPAIFFNIIVIYAKNENNLKVSNLSKYTCIGILKV
jgi:hypothetical protein